MPEWKKETRLRRKIRRTNEWKKIEIVTNSVIEVIVIVVEM